eukprot:2895059-Amphidinium_carterae.1
MSSRSWADVWPSPPSQAASRGPSSTSSVAASRISSNPWAEAVRPMTSTTEAEPADSWSRSSPYDRPPNWDGTQPETQLSAYLKALQAWSLTTRTPLRQRGVAVMAAASGDFRALLGTLEVTEIAAENAVEVIEQLIRKEYSFTLQRTLPQRFEQALFAVEGHRRKGESLLSYTSRKTTMLRELAVAGLELPDLAKGLVMLRDSGLSRSEMDTVYNWAQGDFNFSR